MPPKTYCEYCAEDRYGRASTIYICVSERTNGKGHISRRYEPASVLICPICRFVLGNIRVPEGKEVVVPSHT